MRPKLVGLLKEIVFRTYILGHGENKLFLRCVHLFLFGCMIHSKKKLIFLQNSHSALKIKKTLIWDLGSGILYFS